MNKFIEKYGVANYKSLYYGSSEVYHKSNIMIKKKPKKVKEPEYPPVVKVKGFWQPKKKIC